MRKTEYELPSPVNHIIALVTDLHEFAPEPVLEILREAKPDVIAVAGDTLERHYRGENLDNGDFPSDLRRDRGCFPNTTTVCTMGDWWFLPVAPTPRPLLAGAMNRRL